MFLTRLLSAPRGSSRQNARPIRMPCARSVRYKSLPPPLSSCTAAGPLELDERSATLAIPRCSGLGRGRRGNGAYGGFFQQATGSYVRRLDDAPWYEQWASCDEELLPLPFQAVLVSASQIGD